MITAEIKYKKTGIDWMPDVPEHWEMQRAKTIFVERSIKNKPNEPLLAASQTQGVVLKSMLEQRSMEAIQNFETFKLVETNDFVISLRSFEGGVELAYFKGIISPVYNIFRARNIEYVDVNYFKFIFKSSLFIQELNVYKTGIRDGQSISYKNFGNIFLSIPPLHEQKAIADYLDTQSAKITRFIQTKQRFIELLKEQRQSIITNAVTKGIDDGVKMKETGVDWIPSIPENWSKRRLRFLVKITTGKKNTEDRVSDGEYPFYVRSQTIERINSYSFDGEGILTAGDGVGVGKVFHYVNGKFDFHQRVYLFYDINKEIEGEFLFNYLQANMMSELMRYNSKSTVDSIRLPVIKNFLVVFPERQEQKRILEHIKTETRMLDIAISKAEREIELIKEYREAMIAEAVTGKIKLNFAH